MKLTISELREIIAEEIMSTKFNTKTKLLAKGLLTASTAYVDSIVADKRDGNVAENLKSLATEAVGYAKWLLSKRDPGAEKFALLAKIVNDLASKSGFWQTPMFYKKLEHKEELGRLLTKIERLAVDVMSY